VRNGKYFKRLFSTTGNIVDGRASLSPEILERLLLRKHDTAKHFPGSVKYILAPYENLNVK